MVEILGKYCWRYNYWIMLFLISLSPHTFAFTYHKQIPITHINAIITNATINVSPEHDMLYKYSITNKNSVNNVNLTIKFISHDNLKEWNFGFFMLYVFIKPDNVGDMTICADKTIKCMRLMIDQKPLEHTLANFMLPDTHTLGHITFLKPQHDFQLKSGKAYTITLHSIKSNPQNQTAMPQKLFIYDVATKKFIKIHVNKYATYLNNQNIYSNDLKLHLHDIAPYLLPVCGVVHHFPVIPTCSSIQKNTPLKHNVQNAILNNKSNICSRVIVKSQAALMVQTPIVPLPQIVEIDKSSMNNAKINNAPAIVNIPLKIIPQVFMCQASNQLAECAAINNQPEGYILDITNHSGVNIYANTTTGIFYAKESLLQLQTYYKSKMQVQRIIDYPRYKYRGIMLDVVRHFFTIDEIKKLLDVMAAHKLNTLHLHLADDEGWRIAIKAYPELVTIGSIRGFGKILGAANLIDESIDKTNRTNNAKIKYTDINEIYQGYYTAAQIKDLIRYANMLHITIIPDIEVLGHARAMKRALPELLFEPTDTSSYVTVQGYTDNILPVCKYNAEAKFTQTINEIIKQVTLLFAKQTTIYAVPNEIGLGGDEVPTDAFSGLKYCELGQWRGLDVNQIKNLYYKNIAEALPNYKISGFQEIIEDDNGEFNSKPNSIVPAKNVGHIWHWRPSNECKIKKHQGQHLQGLSQDNYPIVLEFADLSYFDIRYAKSWTETGLYWAANYANTYDAMRIGTININSAVGVEGVMWSELIPTVDHLFYMALPKMAGLAEAGWSDQEELNWQNLAVRLGCGDAGFLAYINTRYGVRYRGYPNGIAVELSD